MISHHRLEIEALHGGAGNDEPVEMLVAHLVKGGVEGLQVLGGRVFRGMADGLEQLHFHLDGRVGQTPQDLRLGGDLGGHEVQQQHAQRAYVLVHGAVLRHHEDVLAFQGGGGGQGVGNADGHRGSFA